MVRQRSCLRNCVQYVAPTGCIRGAYSSPGCPRAARSRRPWACDSSRTFAGVFVHSGIAAGAASSPLAALDVLAHGADTPYERIAAAARARNPEGVVPVCVIQGGRDEVVAEINAVQLVRQYLVRNGRLEPVDRPPAELPTPDAQTSLQVGPGRTVINSDYRIGERVVVRMVRVPELGHAWSGGDAALSYNDPQPPDATALLGEFIVEQIRAQRRPAFWRT